MVDNITTVIADYGFPIVASFGLGYLIFYIWKWVTGEINIVIAQATKTLIELIDRVRMLDNDLIRLNQKLNTLLQIREEEARKKGIDKNDTTLK